MASQYRLEAYRKVPVTSRDQVDDGGLPDGQREHGAHAVRQALEAVTAEEEDVSHAAVLQVGQHSHPELRRLPATAGAGPQPEHVSVRVQVDPDGGVERPVADLPVADLDVDRVDEHGRVHRHQGPRYPR